MLVAFEGLSSPVEFTGCDELVDGTTAILRGRDIRTVEADAAAMPVIRVRRTRRGYQCVSPRFNRPSLCRDRLRTEAVRATCVLHSELIKQHLADNPALACLHCAALEFDGGLVLLTGRFRAGKSTLAAHLAAAGARLFCDDILPIESSESLGIAPGFLPRLRLPLPDGLSPALRAFLADRRGPYNDRSLYVALSEDEIAPFGTTAPIRGVVRLERRNDEAPASIPTAKSKILQTLLRRNIARGLPSLDLLDRLHPIVEGATCFTLRYDRCEDATALLEHVFGAGARAAA